MKRPSKEYTLQWFSLTEGKLNYTETVVTNNPKMELFNFACRMLVMCRFFENQPVGTIIKNVKTGRTAREHYWIEYANGECLSIMETIKKKEDEIMQL